MRSRAVDSLVMALRHAVRRRVAALGISDAAAARRLGWSRQAFSEFMRHRGDVRLATAQHIIKSLGGRLWLWTAWAEDGLDPPVG